MQKQNNFQGITRRRFISYTGPGVLAVTGLASLGQSKAFAQSRKRIVVQVGYQPYGGAASPATNYMTLEHLFAKYAERYGYDVQETYIPLLSGPVVNEALIAGKLDIGEVGPYPTLSVMAAGASVYILCMAEGAVDHAILVRPNSPIKDLGDLVKRKSTVALAVGSSAHQFIEAVFETHFAKSPKEMGLTLLDMPITSQVTFPEGIDAVVPWAPTSFLMEHRGVAVRLLGLNGLTGKAHAQGEGKLLPGLEKAWGYPEGYALHRTVWLGRREFVKAHPALVTAFMQAYQESVYTLHRNRDKAFQVSEAYWRLPKELALQAINQDLLIGRRDWIWPTDGDFSSYIFTSRWLIQRKALKRPVEWSIVKEYTEPRDLVKEAYEKGTDVNPGRYPALAEMTKASASDVRGFPVWEIDKWRLTRDREAKAHV